MADPLSISPVIPVVTVDRVEDAVPLAESLLEGGLGVVEVTLRTDAALDCLAQIADRVPEILLGAGTVLTPADADRAVSAGAQFLVSPGLGPVLADYLGGLAAPYLPGVATVSEVLTAAEQGATSMKFFPAEPAGGTAYLRAIADPLPHIRFCPTGGIGPDDAPQYLALPNVACVGGSWIASRSALAARDFGGIRRRAAEASRL